MLKGIDISHHEGTVDFASAKSAGISFVYHKATEGVDFTDSLFQPNVYNAMKAGLPVGAYHFARPDYGNKPEDEAQHFVNTISVFKYNLLPVLDLEVPVSMTDRDLYNWAKTFIDAVKAQTGYNVMFYTYLDYLVKEYPALKNLANDQVPLWIAEYGSNTAPSIPGWDWVMWQYTESENVPGVGTCDCNYAQDLNAIKTQILLKLGSTGELVRKLQARLGIPVDGIFGPQTEQAVIDFQKAHGLVPDGIVGPKTWAALFPPMYRVTVDGKVVVDSAVPEVIASAVQDAVNNRAQEIIVKPRGY